VSLACLIGPIRPICPIRPIGQLSQLGQISQIGQLSQISQMQIPTPSAQKRRLPAKRCAPLGLHCTPRALP
jgi:hypothetical protein